jgi:hypothetical protein
MMFEVPYNLVTEHDSANGLVINTMVFHTFMLMNIFNMINCRVIDEDQMNAFNKTLIPLPKGAMIFWIIFGFEMYVQFLFVEKEAMCETAGACFFGPVMKSMLGTAVLSPVQRIICWSLAIVPLILLPISKKVPVKLF